MITRYNISAQSNILFGLANKLNDFFDNHQKLFGKHS